MRYNTAETLDALEHQRGISAAEAEVVLDGSADFHLLRLVLADIDAAFRILVDDVDRRRRHLVANRKNRKDAFDTAGTAEQVTRSALGGAHHKLVGVFAEEFAHSAGFVDVAHGGRRAVCIEVVNVLRLQTGVVERHLHGANGAVRSRRRDVIGVTRKTITCEFAVDLGAAGNGVVIVFENKQAAAFTHHKAVTINVERTGSVSRVVIAARKSVHAVKAADADFADRAFGTARKHRGE